MKIDTTIGVDVGGCRYEIDTDTLGW